MLVLSRVVLLISLLANPILAAGKIDINTAPLEELIKIKHIGEGRAEQLIALRPFSSLDELVRINGIGEARLRDIKEEGLAWVAESQTRPLSSPEEETAIEFNPGSANMISSLSPQEKEDEEKAESSLAITEEQIPKTSNATLRIFLTALGVAIFSGAVIIFLKKRLA